MGGSHADNSADAHKATVAAVSVQHGHGRRSLDDDLLLNATPLI